MKADRIRAEINVSAKLKAIALVCAILDGLFGYDREHALKSIAAYYSYTLTKVTL